MIVKPFRALRPRQDLAAKVASYPYDVVSSAEARELAAGDPHTFLHVVKSEVDLDPQIEPYADAVYDKARENLLAMIEKGWMLRDDSPSYYIYRLKMGDHVQTGLLGAAAIQDYLDDRIKKHEHTRPEKEQDRIKLNDRLGANPGPVFLTYRALPELNAVINAVVEGEPVAHFVAADEIEHTLWGVASEARCSKIEKLFGQVRCTYVADGHHRAAAAAKVGGLRAAALEQSTGAESCHFFLAAHFPADQILVMDYNRVVTDLNGLDTESFLERIDQAGFSIQPNHRARRPPHSETFGMYLGKRWYLLIPRPEIAAVKDPVEKLDISLLTRHLLQPVLGIADQRTDRRVDFVGGIRGMDELVRRVDSGDAAVAFALFPTSLEHVMSVADAGKVMPPKSTWFEPKLRSGLVVQLLDDETL